MKESYLKLMLQFIVLNKICFKLINQFLSISIFKIYPPYFKPILGAELLWVVIQILKSLKIKGRNKALILELKDNIDLLVYGILIFNYIYLKNTFKIIYNLYGFPLKYFLSFNYTLHYMLFCIGFRCTA